MKLVKFAVAAALYALAAMFTASTSLNAGEVTAPTPDQPSPSTSPPPAKPLMAGLSAIGLGDPLNMANINIYGYVEGGYFYDASSPKSGHGPTFIGFNSFKSQGVLNKVDLSIERALDPAKKQFDIGFHVEGIWGTDAAFIHSNGLGDHQTGRNQGDLLQAYVDATMPGIPLRIRAGKWIELAGFEQFSANIYGAFGDPSKALYSYSYQFLYAEPGTQTGILATYVLNDQWSFDAGFTRGWNQSVKDSNGKLDFLGRITFTPSDKTSVIFVMTEGPEFPPGVGSGLPKGDNSHWWTALDLVVTQKIADNLNLGLGVDYVHAPHIPGFKSAQNWGGLAGYVSYVIDPHFTLNGRVEWYSDTSGFSTGAAFGANYYEATLGMSIKPAPNDAIFSNLLLRPEIRSDYSNRKVFDSGAKSQLTFAIDAVFTF